MAIVELSHPRQDSNLSTFLQPADITLRLSKSDMAAASVLRDMGYKIERKSPPLEIMSRFFHNPRLAFRFWRMKNYINTQR